jgi:very-short-patch-repair endonuclease
MVTAAFILAHHDGIARGAKLKLYGVSPRMLNAEVRSGAIERVRAGVYALPTTDPAIVTAAAHGGALTCSRALKQHGVWSMQDDVDVHVWLGGNGRTHHVECGCVGHWDAGRSALGLAPLEEVLVHVFRCAGDEAFFAALESALGLRKISRSTLAQLRRRLPAHARWLIDAARTDAASGLESLLRLRLLRRGIRLECQVDIPTVGRVDFVVGGRLILEADGAEHHGAASHRHRDLVRDAAASVLGYETLRFDYAQIMHDWASVEAAVLAALVRLGSR